MSGPSIDQEKFREGGHEFFEELVRRFGPLVLSVARAYGRDADHVEDLFQEVWRRVYEKRRSFSAQGSFEAWLYRVASRVCIGDYRARRARGRALARLAREADGRAGEAPAPGPLEGIERREFRTRLHEAMAHLTERELEAISLRVLEGMTTVEVAAAMGIQTSSVRSIIRNGLARMRAILEKREDELSGL